MKKITALLLAIIIVLSCTACGNTPTPSTDFQLEDAPADVALILGAHANRFALAPFLEPHVENITKPLQFGGSVTIIENDSSPSPVTIHYSKIQTSMSKYQQDQEKAEKARELIAKVVLTKADDPETDLLKCLAAAASALMQGSAAQKLIIILDSGVASTAGEINLTTLPVFTADKDTILAHMETQGTFAKGYVDLSDATVIWTSFACTATPQEDLTAKAVSTLKSFWEAVLYRLGAKDVRISPNYGGQQAYIDLPDVTPVQIPEIDNLDISHIEKLVLRETLLFIPDSTTAFLNPAEAAETLDKIASILNGNHQTILIAGSIATIPSPDKGVSFSRERAETVKTELVKRGVSADRLTTLGLGYTGPDHVNDLSADGTLNEEEAVFNRNITLYDLSSENAQQLLHAEE